LPADEKLINFANANIRKYQQKSNGSGKAVSVFLSELFLGIIPTLKGAVGSVKSVFGAIFGCSLA